ncbi:MAG: hypothetical protein N2170_07745 [Bacteroidia bacterium]|nr:hypothetical protein [Bacteroidia bacterium]
MGRTAPRKNNHLSIQVKDKSRVGIVFSCLWHEVGMRLLILSILFLGSVIIAEDRPTQTGGENFELVFEKAEEERIYEGDIALGWLEPTLGSEQVAEEGASAGGKVRLSIAPPDAKSLRSRVFFLLYYPVPAGYPS